MDDIREWWIKTEREYTVPVTGIFEVKSCRKEKWEAEDEAWNLMESALKTADVDKYEIYETRDIVPCKEGHKVTLSVDFVIYSIGDDATDAWGHAETLVENISLPDNVELVGTEQHELVEENERMLIVGE